MICSGSMAHPSWQLTFLAYISESVYQAEHSFPPSNLQCYISESVYQAEHSFPPSNLQCYTSVVSLPSRTQHSSLKPTMLHLCGQFTKQNTAFLPQTYNVTPLWSVYQAEHSIPPSNLQCYTSVVSLPSRTQHSSLKPTMLHLCGQFTKQNTAFLPQTYNVTPLWSVYQAEHSIPPSNLQCYTSVVSLPSRTWHSSLKLSNSVTLLRSVYQAEHSIPPSNCQTVLHFCGQFTKQNIAFLPQTVSVTPLWSVYQAEHSIPPSNHQTVLHFCGQFTKQNIAFLPQTIKQCYTSVVSLPSRT